MIDARIIAMVELADNNFVWIGIVVLALILLGGYHFKFRAYIKKFAPLVDQEQRLKWPGKISSKLNPDGSTLKEDKR